MRHRLGFWRSNSATAEPASPHGRARRKTIQRLGSFVAVATLLLTTLAACGPGDGGRPYSHITPQSEVGDDIQGVYRLVFWMAVVVFILVQFLIVYAALRFRRRRIHTQRPAQIHGNQTLEIAWTIIPAIILLIIFIPTAQIMYRFADASQDGDMVVEVYGKQWWWEFHYPGLGGEDADGNSLPLITANEVRLPEDTKVQFKVYSNNVIHSFWVPQLAGKMDLIPGHENIIAFTPHQSGVYYGECAEFCGAAHAWMRFIVKVQPQEEFDSWLSAMTSPPSSAAAAYVPDGDVARTPQEFGVCLLCHNIGGTNASNAQVGIASDPTGYNAAPDLTLFGCRDTIAAGVLENNPENLALWLREPGNVKYGNYMHALNNGILNQGEEPTGGRVALTDEQIAVLVPYLLALIPEEGCPEGGLEATSFQTGRVASGAEPVPQIQATPEVPATPEVDGTPVPETDEAVLLEADDILWVQEELIVEAGGEIVMRNLGQAPHNFVIVGYEPLEANPFDIPIGGEEVTYQLPDDLGPGEYEFFCDVPGHQQLMRGVLVITEPGEGTDVEVERDAAQVDDPADSPVTDADDRLEAIDIAWNQTELSAPAGGTIEMVNLGQAEHNFVIVDYGPLEADPFDIPIGGEPVVYTLPDDLEPGEYEYFCDVPGHQQIMRGTLTITESTE